MFARNENNTRKTIKTGVVRGGGGGGGGALDRSVLPGKTFESNDAPVTTAFFPADPIYRERLPSYRFGGVVVTTLRAVVTSHDFSSRDNVFRRIAAIVVRQTVVTVTIPRLRYPHWFRPECTRALLTRTAFRKTLTLLFFHFFFFSFG